MNATARVTITARCPKMSTWTGRILWEMVGDEQVRICAPFAYTVMVMTYLWKELEKPS